jgi:hypothetical protein
VARVLAVVPDLILASRVRGSLEAAGHDVEQAGSIPDTHGRHKHRGHIHGADLIVADLEAAAPEALAALGVPVIGFYPHTDVEIKRRADAAGLALAVPRSRMARELPALAERVLAAA